MASRKLRPEDVMLSSHIKTRTLDCVHWINNSTAFHRTIKLPLTSWNCHPTCLHSEDRPLIQQSWVSHPREFKLRTHAAGS